MAFFDENVRRRGTITHDAAADAISIAQSDATDGSSSAIVTTEGAGTSSPSSSSYSSPSPPMTGFRPISQDHHHQYSSPQYHHHHHHDGGAGNDHMRTTPAPLHQSHVTSFSMPLPQESPIMITDNNSSHHGAGAAQLQQRTTNSSSTMYNSNYNNYSSSSINSPHQQHFPYPRTGYIQPNAATGMSPSFASSLSHATSAMHSRPATRHDAEKFRKKSFMRKVIHGAKMVLCCNGRPLVATGVYCCLLCIAAFVMLVMLIRSYLHATPEIWDQSVKFIQRSQDHYFGKPKMHHPPPLRDDPSVVSPHSEQSEGSGSRESGGYGTTHGRHRPPISDGVEPPLREGEELINRVKEEADRMVHQYRMNERDRRQREEHERKASFEQQQRQQRQRDENRHEENEEFQGFKGVHGRNDGHHHHTHYSSDQQKKFNPDQEDFGHFVDTDTDVTTSGAGADNTAVQEDQTEQPLEEHDALRRKIIEMHERIKRQTEQQQREEEYRRREGQEKDLVDHYASVMDQEASDGDVEKQSKLQRLKDRKGTQQRLVIKQFKTHLRELVHTVTERAHINIAVVENRNKALLYWLQAIEKGFLQHPNSNTLIHISAHHNLEVPRRLHMDLSGSEEDWIASTFKDITPNNYIIPMAYYGILSKIVWVKPPWIAQEDEIPNGSYTFTIGNVGDTQGVGIDSNGVLPFFSVRTPAVRLKNSKTVELEVISLSDWIQQGNSAAMDKEQQKLRHEQLVGVGKSNAFNQPPLLNIDLSAIVPSGGRASEPDFSEKDISRVGLLLETLLRYVYHLPSLQKPSIRKSRISRPGLVVVSRSLKYKQIPLEWWPDAEESVYVALINAFMEPRRGRKRINDFEELFHRSEDSGESDTVDEDELSKSIMREIESMSNDASGQESRGTYSSKSAHTAPDNVGEQEIESQLREHEFLRKDQQQQQQEYQEEEQQQQQHQGNNLKNKSARPPLRNEGHEAESKAAAAASAEEEEERELEELRRHAFFRREHV